MAITAGSRGTIPVGILGAFDNDILTNISTTDHLIQGQMVEVNMTLDPYEITKMTDDQIKTKIMFFLGDEMLKRKCVEFTRQHDVVTNKTIIRARTFVTPDTNVKILRTIKNDNKSY